MPGERVPQGPIDVERARADTPGCAHVVHLNNAGAALPPRPVLDAVRAHLDLEARIGGYEAAEERAEALDAVYGAVARLLGCTPEEVALTESATRAWDAVFSAFTFAPGDRILVSRVEYGSNYLAVLQVARRTGAVVEVIPDGPDGACDPGALAGMLDDRVRLVAVTHVPTESGLVNPAAAIGAVTRAAGVPFLLDACQSVGQMPVDVEATGCDALAATGRKFLRGPRGTGFLYVRRELWERLAPFEPYPLDIHGAEWLDASTFRVRPDARRFEQWERSCANLLGLGAAVEYALAWGLDAVRDRVFALAAALRERLAAGAGVTVRDGGRERCGIVSFTVDGRDPHAVRDDLRSRGVNVSVAVASSARLDLDRRGLPAVLRASPHYYNTDADLDRLATLV